MPDGPVPPPPVRRRAVVRGIVQGVGFRWSCTRAAERLGVAGWVRNLPDGAVEVAVEGSAERVEQMLGWLARGPRFAQVTSVEVEEEPPVGEAGFHIIG
ncbi:MAG: acylphosphatase [Actinobacteria bacterium]|nr:acylphosphatase [Actinomycetota bacterium]MCG2800695.1 acylphosphatase [Cellulomonas sp.]